MSYGKGQSAINQYNQAAVNMAAEQASPHRLIQMLMQGALDKIAIARGAMERGETARKGEHISWAISIISGLRGSLDLSAGELAANLDNLYEYMERRLVEANIENNLAIIDEVATLLKDIKGAWDAIGSQVDNLPSKTEAGVSR